MTAPARANPDAAILSVQPALKVFHTTEPIRAYPGERVTLFTRVETGGDLSGFRLQVTLPPGLKFEGTRSSCRTSKQAPKMPVGVEPIFSPFEGILYLIWDVKKDEGSKLLYDFEVTAQVMPTQVDRRIESVASVKASSAEARDEEVVAIAVKAKGAYLKYLPSIYQDDDLMGRLLMLFESFLAPLEQRIDHMPNYLDARMTPAEMMPWLASWTGLVLDSELSETQRRKLLWNAGSLYLRRGTRGELQEYLEIITGGKVEVIDSPGFRLGQKTYLGLGIALGQGNLPYTFSVTVRLPSPPADFDDEERSRSIQDLERKVRTVINMEKPAHTDYKLQIFYEAGQAVQS